MKYLFLLSMLLFAATMDSTAQVLNVSRVTVKGSPVFTQRDTTTIVATKSFARSKPGVRIIPETSYGNAFGLAAAWTPSGGAPTGALRAFYWGTVDSVLREVRVTVSFGYAVAGTNLTSLDFPIPSGLPAPKANPAYQTTTYTVPSGHGRFLTSASAVQNAAVTAVITCSPGGNKFTATTASGGNFNGGYFTFVYPY